MTAFKLRPMAAEDRATVEHIYVATRAEELALLALPAQQKAQLMAMQAAAQLTDYRSRHPNASYDLIEVDGNPVGRLFVARDPEQILLLEVAVLPELQSRGIGTVVIETLKAEARAQAITLQLSVLRSNTRAKALYERLGFIGDDTTSTELYLGMVWCETVRPR